MKKNAFTLIEIVLVLLIISILFFVFSSIFQVKDQDILHGQNCIDTLYGEINTFLDNAMRGKSLQISGGAFVYPDIYYIGIDKDTNIINLSYQEGSGSISLYNEFTLTGSSATTSNCKTASYDVRLSGNNLGLTIHKVGTQNFVLSGANNFTGSIDFMQCKASLCKQIGQFTIDMRTQSIQKKMCLTLSGNNCEEWDR